MVSPSRVSLPMAHVRKLEVCEKIYNLVMNIANALLSFKFNFLTGIFASVLINDFLEYKCFTSLKC